MIDIQPFMVDIILAIIAAEFVLLWWLLRRRNLNRLVAPLFWFLASGAALMTALRFSLAPDQASLTPFALMAACALHVICIIALIRAFRG